jgi:hypothetical protein
VGEARQGKNRMHIDVLAPDVDAEATRLEGIGARREPDGRILEFGMEWIRMADPEGNEFCICRQ